MGLSGDLSHSPGNKEKLIKELQDQKQAELEEFRNSLPDVDESNETAFMETQDKLMKGEREIKERYDRMIERVKSGKEEEESDDEEDDDGDYLEETPGASHGHHYHGRLLTSNPADYDQMHANVFSKYLKRALKIGAEKAGFREAASSVMPLDSYKTGGEEVEGIASEVIDKIGLAIDRFKLPRKERLAGSVPATCKYFTVKPSKNFRAKYDKRNKVGQLVKADGYLFFDLVIPGGVPISTTGEDTIDVKLADVRKKAFPGVDTRFNIELSVLEPEAEGGDVYKGIAYLTKTMALLLTIEGSKLTEMVFVEGDPKPRK